MPQLASIAYREHEGDPRSWELRPTKIDHVNLIVGMNASGKTRLVNVITGCAALIQNKVQPLWSSGIFKLTLRHNDSVLSYNVSVKDRSITSETLFSDSKRYITRDSDGRGTIWSDKLSIDLEFKVPTTLLCAVTKRDEIQHPYLENLHLWAASVRRYPFGSEMGHNQLYALLNPQDDNAAAESKVVASDDPNKVTEIYNAGWNAFGEEFDNAILRDFKSAGFNCTHIGASVSPEIQIQLPQGVPLFLFVKERDLETVTWQHAMSMGMYRSLAIIIHLNYSIATKQATCILIDDIGEGLDHERSIKLISVLIKKAKRAGVQLIMTTNDKFVMNEVDLSHWHILRRKSSVVEVINKYTDPKLFEEFKFLGLSNFDLLSSGLQGRKSR